MNRNYVTEENRVYLPDENWNILAEIYFEKVNENTYNISRTFVDNRFRWQGIGGELVERAVAYLTSKWYKVSATCSYAKKIVK